MFKYGPVNLLVYVRFESHNSENRMEKVFVCQAWIRDSLKSILQLTSVHPRE